MMKTLEFFDDKKIKDKFFELQITLVPIGEKLNLEEVNENFSILNQFLKSKPDDIKRKIKLFIRVIDILSFLRYFKIFSSLNKIQRNIILNFLFDNPIGLLRKGFWGINTLAKLGIYSQASVQEKIGYFEKQNAQKG